VRDEKRAIRYRVSSKACAAKAGGANAREWRRLAACWEFLAQVREAIPILVLDASDLEQDRAQQEASADAPTSSATR